MAFTRVAGSRDLVTTVPSATSSRRAPSPARIPLGGARAAAISAATHTACRWLAGPWRIARQTSAATPAASGICQRELSKKVSRERLIVSILLFLRVLQQFLNLREFLRGQLTGFHQVQHQAIG